MSDQSPDPRSPADWLSSIRQAASFLTIAPVGSVDGGLRPLSAATPAFPLVGAGVGLACGLVWLVVIKLGAASVLAAALAVLAGVLLTRGLHEDGLADTADALGPPHADRERRLEILRDSRIGTFGALALVFSVALRIVALAELTPGQGFAAMIAAHALSRAALVWPWSALIAARPDGLAAAEGAPSDGARSLALGIGAAIAVVCLLAGVGFLATLAAFLAGMAATVGISRVAGSRFGGYTGDVLGATQQAVEIAVLVAVALVAG